ncbi:hypothetical protein AV654_32590 [Paenibacillus elgii]|uniref:RDD domain-containing protein n=1 Tax=Paenibacillus elgii TaxID=189691 RepID=A0A163UJK5_9BACL|nr:RDD family protein [Paenibacillus elgii]KZE73416.1 hypothetical protein AV654_32590 [Paenibacillus elgii]
MNKNRVSYAGFFERFFAFVIDLFVMIVIGTIIGYGLLGLLPTFSSGINPDSFESVMTTMLVYPLVFWLYYALSESSLWMSTLGKKLLGIQVVDYSFERISFSRATARFFSKFVSVFIMYIGFIMVAFTKNKQGLHDIISGCYVIKK